MDFSIFVEWAFYGIISWAAIYGVSILKEMRNSIEKLNVSVATIIIKHEWHDSEINDIKKRLGSLENK